MKPRVVSGWFLTGIVSVFLAFDAFGKIAKIPQVLRATEELGFAREATLTLGVLLLVGLVLHLIPRTATLGAIYLTGYLGGAVAIHLRAGSPLFSHLLFPVYIGAMMWGGYLLRNPTAATALWGPSRSTESSG